MEFQENGTLEVLMVKYLKNLIEGFLEVIKGRAVTPASDKLFQVQDKKDATLLGEEQAIASHHTTAQLLFMAGRVRRDIHMVVAFLSMRVKSPDKDDWGKLKRLLKYLNRTKYLKLTISVEDLGVLKWYMGAAHTVHGTARDMWGNAYLWGWSGVEIL